MKDIIDICYELKDKYGDEIFLDKYTPPIGHYFKLDKNFKVIDYFNFNKKTAEEFLQSENYDFFKERVFFEGMITANKAINSNKKIHSVTSNAIFLKYSSINEEIKVNKEVVSLADIIKLYFETLEKKYNCINIYENKINGFINIIANKEFTNSIDKGVKLAGTDRLMFFVDEPIEKYKEEYMSYLKEKISLDKDSEIIKDGNCYGVFSKNLSLNKKKPFYSNNPYSSYPMRILIEEMLILNYIFKLNPISLIELIHLENPKFELDYNLDYEISNYKVLGRRGHDTKKEFNDICILSSDFNNSYKGVISLNREDIKEKIDKEMTCNNKGFLLSKVLVNNLDTKNYYKNFSSNQLGVNFIVNKDLLNIYFNKNGDINISKQVEQILYPLYRNFVLNGDSFVKSRQKFDSLLNILRFLGKRGVDDMVTDIQSIWDKLIKARETKEFKIESDEEFFFVCGQTLYYLSSKSKSGTNTGLIIQDVFSIKDSDNAKDKLIYKYDKYKYLLNSHENNFINIIYSNLMAYKIGKNIRIKDNKNLNYYYQAGLIGKNIFYKSLKKDN